MATVFDRRYHVKRTLGQGNMGVVYRVEDRLTGQDVALKRVLTQNEGGAIISAEHNDTIRLALAREFHMLASLRHPNIISVLDYGFTVDGTARMPYLTMTLLENARDILTAGHDQNPNGKIHLLIQTLQALDYLHRRGIIHRDIKPNNLMVVGDQLRVVDFGLSTHRHQEREETAGTLSYIAPEVLSGNLVTHSADLYAVGVIAYELFAGHHPFDTNDISTLITDVLNTTPEVTKLDVDETIAAVVARLLMKSPDDRYADALETVHALCEAAQIDPPGESAAIRESYLQSAQFVGRDDEMATLMGGLATTMKGNGAGWLIGGESGVGKTRLIEELRAYALVQGAVVVRGQAISENTAPYHLWRDVVRWLCLSVTLSDIEAQVLKSLVPDIARLVGYAVSDPPDLDADTTRSRLRSVIVAVLERALKSLDDKRALVIVLEDLHWASSAELALLAQIESLVIHSPLMIVGTYRTEESPSLPSQFPWMACQALMRLDDASIAELSEAMLGAAGKNADVVALLQRETEGNVFFLVEVVRTLAQDAGRLESVGRRTLPEQVFAGGMQTIVERRLGMVSEADRAVLRLAAVGGRWLDLDALLLAAKDTDIDAWLVRCADALILDVSHDRWRFAHDKLREGLLHNLNADDKRTLHRRIATAIENAHAGNLSDHAVILAHHWGSAQDSTRERQYITQAGEQALISGAYDEAEIRFKRALALAQTDKERAHIQRQLGQTYLGQGKLQEGRKALKSALDLLGHGLPASERRLRLGILRQILLQVAYRSGLPVWISGDKTPEVLLDAAGVYERVGELYYFANRTAPSLYSALRGMNLAEAGGESPELARSYANVGFGLGLNVSDALARLYLRRAREVAERVADAPATGQAHLMSGLFHAGNGAWKTANTHLDTAETIYAGVGDLKRHEQALTSKGHIACIRGDYMETARINAKVYASATRRADPQMQASALVWQAAAQAMLGDTEKALRLTNDAYPLFSSSEDRGLQIIGYAALTVTYFRMAQLIKAMENGEKGLAVMGDSAPTSFSALPSYVGITAMFLQLWERNPRSIDPKLVGASEKGCAALETYTRVYPIGKPYTLVCRGWLSWLTGEHRKAHQHWQEAIITAQHFDMPYAEGMAHLQSGRHALSFSEREYHLKQAATIFTRLNTRIDLERVNLLLK